MCRCNAMAAAFVILMLSRNSQADFLLIFDAEAGATPQSVGFQEANSLTSGTSAPSAVNIPQLGNFVWEYQASSSSTGYILDVSGQASLHDGFIFSSYFRQLDGTYGHLERNRPAGSFLARPSNVTTSIGQWYFHEMRRNPGEETFTRSLFQVDHNNGNLSLIKTESETGRFAGSPGSLLFPNSVGFYTQNNGSSFLRTQVDNVRIEFISAVPEPNSAILIGLLLGFISFRRTRSRPRQADELC